MSKAMTEAAGFHANQSLPGAPDLFRFNPGIPVDAALEHARVMVGSVVDIIGSLGDISSQLYGAMFMAESAEAAIEAALAAITRAQQTGGGDE